MEAIKANIDATPASLGTRAERSEAAGVVMDAAAKRSGAAKGAIKSALFDAVGKTPGIPASALLLGGAVRGSVPVLWTLASDDPAGAGRRVVRSGGRARHFATGRSRGMT